MRNSFTGILIWLVACGSNPGAVRPDDMSAAQHRREAEREQQLADEHATNVDPQGVKRTPDRPLNGGGPEDYMYPTRLYHPGEDQQREADRHRAHAAEHERAAAELEGFEEAECKQLPPETRASCPMFGPVAAVVDIEGGVRIELAEGVPLDAVVAHMRCHYAYARTRGFAVAEGCPLYVRGIEIRASADGQAIEITAGDPATVEHVRQRAREQAVPGAPII